MEFSFRPLMLSLMLAPNGCAACEDVTKDIDHGLRTTQQDVSSGIRGKDTDEAPPPAAAASARRAPAMPAPTAPATQQPPAPAPAATPTGGGRPI